MDKKNAAVLKGLVDIHIHAGPSLMPREIDAIEMAQAAIKAGYRAISIKDHYYCTAAMSGMIEKHFAKESGLKVFGGLALNNAVGGLNPKAADAAIALGSKIIYMPTVSSENHIVKHQGHGFKFPQGKAMSLPESPITMLDEKGNLVPEAVACIEVVAKYPDVVLATGHGTREEVNAIVEKAHEFGVKHLCVNHPTYMIGATLDDLKYWASLGAYIEHTAVLCVPSSALYCLKTNEIVEAIRVVGAEHTILSSDWGQAGNGSPVDGIAKFIELLRENGISEDELVQMTQSNPSKLLSLDNN